MAGNARDKKGLWGRGKMGDGKQRKRRLARRLPLSSHCKHCNSSTSSSIRDGAPAVIHQTEFAEKAMAELPATADPLTILSSLRCSL